MTDNKPNQESTDLINADHKLLKLFSYPLLDAPWKISIVSTIFSLSIFLIVSSLSPNNFNLFGILTTVICASSISYLVSKLTFPYYKLIEYQHQQLMLLNTRITNELALAYNIQQSLLPLTPVWNELDIATFNKPAYEVGGDFYSFYSADNHHFIFSVGDVSGKGVSAALLMAATLSSFDLVLSQQHFKPSDFLIKLDDVLTHYTQLHRQNCALCYVEFYNGMLHIANAGGIPPYIRRTQGGVEWPEVGGFALGQGLGKDGYQEISIPLYVGDLVILTSDGLVEAMNETGEMFGFERVEQMIANGPVINAQSMLKHLLAEISAFTNQCDPHDDMTIVIFQVKG